MFNIKFLIPVLRKIIASIALLIWVKMAFAQPIERRFINYTLEDGLSQSTIMDIKQSANGNIFMATADGVNVFDGKSFEIYKNNPADTQTLGNNLIYCVTPISTHIVWALDQDQILNQIDTRTKKVVRLNYITKLGIDNIVIKQVLLAANGEVWFATYEHGIIVINTFGKKLASFNIENKTLKSNSILHLYSKDDQIWASTSAGLAKINIESKTVVNYFINRAINCAHINKNKLYVSFNDKKLGVIIANKENPNMLYDSILQNESVVAIESQKSGIIWFGSSINGVYEFDNHQLVHHFNKPQDKWSLIDNNIWTIFKDVNDDIYIGTNNGLTIFKNAYNIFKLYRHNPLFANSLSSNRIYNIVEDSKNAIWFITYDGEVNRLQNGKFTIYDKNNCTGLNTTHLRTLFETNDGQYFVGSYDDGFYKFDPKRKKFTNIRQKGQNISEVRIIKQINESTLLIGHAEGLIYYNYLQNTFKNIDLGFSFKVYDLFLDGDYCYIATFGAGLIKWSMKDNSTKTFRHINEKNSLSNNNVMSIVAVSKDTLALGTYGGGVSLFHKINHSFLNFSESNGLSNNSVYGILLDNKNNLWLSTNKGIVKWFADRKTIKNFNLSSQLQSLEFNEGAFLAAKNGMFYFGGVNGVNFFNPSQLMFNNRTPNAIILNIIINGKNIDWQDIAQKKAVNLRANQNTIKIIFKALHYGLAEKTLFYYKLEGIETSWTLLNNKDNSITFNNLPSGNYQFLLKACNEDDLCDEVPKKFSFVINAPLYKTPIFIFISGMLLLLLFYAIYATRTRNLRRSYAAKMTDAELRALRTQMNPHFIFNTLNSIQYYVLNADAKTAYKYLTKFSSLMRRILQHSKENFLPLEEELTSLKLYCELENIRLENGLEVKFDIDAKIDQKRTLIPTLFLQPFVENAIIHGLLPKQGDKKISIIVKKSEKGVICIIQDNGIGREKSRILNKQRSRSHQSTAINAIEHRIDILNESTKMKLKMEIEDLNDGTRVSLIIEQL